MKVLFSNLPWWAGRERKLGVLPVRRAGVRAGSRWPFTYTTLSFPGWRMPFEYLPMPFFLTYAAAYLAQEVGVDVTVRDSIARRESEESFYRYLVSADFDFIVIESATPSWEYDQEVILRIKKSCPKTRIVVCGPITAEKASAILASLPVTACIKGEYEKGVVEVVGGKTGIIDYDLLSVDEMNAAPWPMYDEDVATDYYDRNPRGVRLPQAQVWASRGCPFKCIFCVWPATMTGSDPDGQGKRGVRHYTAEYLEPFLRHIVRRYGYRSIYFDDDTFNLGNRHTLEMCAMMKRIGLPWAAMCRTDTIQMTTWEEMRRSGCYGVKLGFESGNQYVVDHIVNKSLDLQHGAEVVRFLKQLGMTVHGTFTIGLPGETPEQMRETLAFAELLPFDSTQVSGCAEIEGTPLHALRTKGHLEIGFSGARMDGHYNRAEDGNRKFQELIARLRNG